MILRSFFKRNKVINYLYSRIVSVLFSVDTLLLIQRTQDGILRKIKLRNSKCNTKIVLVLDVRSKDVNVEHAKRTIDSLYNQNFYNWHLYVIGELADLLEDDNRVTSTLVNLPEGTFIGQIYVGDILHRNALLAFAEEITKNTHLLYCDQDTINVSGQRVNPIFKPEWNDELSYSTFYMGSLTLYRLRCFGSLHGWLGFDSHYQRVLHLRRNSDGIFRHVDYILYHSCTNHENPVLETDLIELNKFLEKYKAKAMTGLTTDSYKINWPLPDILPLVSIIIPTKNAHNIVKQCIDSIYKLTSYQRIEIILVDNQSDDQRSTAYFNSLESKGKVKLLRFDGPFNYSAINNFAVANANGEILILMNNDIEVISPEWLTEMVRHLCRDEVGCVGAKLYYPNDTIQHAGVILGLGRCAGYSHKHYQRNDNGYMNRLKLVQNYGAVTAACLGVRRDVYEEVGGLNEEKLSVAYNDIDFCLKVQKAGYQNVWSPYIELYHHESLTRNDDFSPEEYTRYMSELDYMQRTWKLDKFVDPAYSQWLTISKEDFSYDDPVFFHVTQKY
ncbi:glycosyltransferase [Vibrio sp. JC009]|uniref:glycosyltransferase family 2 protein n=1 Tax=Vibrio sp. JC009 TaxID=2912314 RepID=UPI0023AE9738|nr:glycosyltransferase [Vibrio sp. JC009]WED24160.1 glycosyltransferase [Vibrio sp. JC009]